MTTEIAKKPVDRLKEVMSGPTVKEQFRNALGKSSSLFVASVLDLFASDKVFFASSFL